MYGSTYLSRDMHDRFYEVLKTLDFSRADACKNVDELNTLFLELKDAKSKIEDLMDCIQVNAALSVKKITSLVDGSFLDKCAGVIRKACGAKLIPCFERGGTEEDCAKLLKTLKEEFFDYLPGKFYLGIPGDVGGDHTYRYIDFWLEDIKCAFKLEIPQNIAPNYDPLLYVGSSASEFYGGIRVGLCNSGQEGWVKEWVFRKDFASAAKNLAERLKSDDCTCNKVPDSRKDDWTEFKADEWKTAMNGWKEVFSFWDNLAKKHGLA